MPIDPCAVSRTNRQVRITSGVTARFLVAVAIKIVNHSPSDRITAIDESVQPPADRSGKHRL
jgi:hypothetical protein